jgi:hypothetical protein
MERQPSDGTAAFTGNTVQLQASPRKFLLGTQRDLRVRLGGLDENGKPRVSASYACALKKAAFGSQCARVKYFDIEEVVSWLEKNPGFKTTDVYPSGFKRKKKHPPQPAAGKLDQSQPRPWLEDLHLFDDGRCERLKLSHLAQLLYLWLKKDRLPQTELCRRSGVLQCNLSRLLSGKTRSINSADLDRFLRAFPNPEDKSKLVMAYFRDMLPPGAHEVVSITPLTASRRNRPVERYVLALSARGRDALDYLLSQVRNNPGIERLFISFSKVLRSLPNEPTLKDVVRHSSAASSPSLAERTGTGSKVDSVQIETSMQALPCPPGTLE